MSTDNLVISADEGNQRSRFSEADHEAIRVATTTELTHDRLLELSPLWRRIAHLLYRPTTEFIITGIILISVGIAVFEILISPNPFSFGAESPEEGPLRRVPILFWIDVVISIVFVVEYGLRLKLAPKRWPFIKSHLIDLIALLPLLRIFRLGRLFRIVRILRILRIFRSSSLAVNPLHDLLEALKPNSTEQMVVSAYLIFSIMIGTTGVMIFERNADSGFDTVWDGIWWTMVTVTTVGYGDRAPETAGGRIVAGFVMVVGLSFYGVVTGMISKSLIDRTRSRKEGGVSTDNLRDHLIVCGWNDDTEPLLSSVQSSGEYTGVVIVTSRSLENENLPSDVAWVRGDPTEHEVLERAGMKYAKSVIILAEEREGMTPQDVDARSILVAMAIEHANESVHTLVQLLRETNRRHCTKLGVDEVIVSSQFDGTILRKAAQYPGTSKLYDEFLGFKSKASLHLADVDEAFAGTTFGNASALFIRDGRGVPIAVRRDDEVIHVPRSDFKLEPGDMLILVKGEQ